MPLLYDSQTSIDALFDETLLQKYNTSGPRYTSYPTAVSFTETFNTQHVIQASRKLSTGRGADTLGLYIHIPFCHELCFYCGCNKIVTRHQEKADRYLQYLKKEAQQWAENLTDVSFQYIHLGGGTPNFLTSSQLTTLMDSIQAIFSINQDAELSIELDPRTIEINYLNTLKKLGFNRLSFGVQDANIKVQKAINRVQSKDKLTLLTEFARMLEFKSINFDLIYGLPHQSSATMRETLSLVRALSPDRVSLFNYAHMPALFAAQRKIKDNWLPSANDKLALFKQAVNAMIEQGYIFIGMDHFAKPNDKLSLAYLNKRLFRNFQGYTSEDAKANIGLGCSAISNIGNTYAQNAKTLNDYYVCIDKQTSPIKRGILLTRNDQIRRCLIQTLMSNLEIDKQRFSQQFQINFADYFANEMASLQPFITDGLLVNNANKITVLEKGRLFIRNICMSFDQYLSKSMHQMRYSRVV